MNGKVFVCYVQRHVSGFRKAIYRSEVSATPITLSDSKSTVTTAQNLMLYLTDVLQENTVKAVDTVNASTLTEIEELIASFATGVNYSKKNSIKIALVDYVFDEQIGAVAAVKVDFVKNSVKTTTYFELA